MRYSGTMAHAPSHTTYAPQVPFRARSGTLPGLWARLRVGERPDIALFVALLIGAIFAADLLLPLGIAGGVPYVAPVLVTAWLPARRFMLPVAALCSALTVLGFFLSPPGASLWAVVPNRALAVGAVWVVALLSLERKRIEEALSESEAKTRAVLASTADGILTLDSRGRIASANTAAERIFGYSKAELVSRPLGVLLGPADRRPFARDPLAFLEAASSAAAFQEIEGRRRGGTTFPAECILVPLSLPTGTLYTATVRDISERRLFEQHLLRTTEEERQAIGHDLHEELGQTLTGLNLISRGLARRLEDQHAAEASEAADLAELLHEADALALRLFESLVPVGAKGGLPEALNLLVREAAHRHGARYTVQHAGEMPPLDELHASELYRIVQDLVNWALQQGGIRDVVLQIGSSSGDSSVSLRLRGAAPPDPDRWAGTVQRLRYRAQLIGMRLQVSSPGARELLVTCSL